MSAKLEAGHPQGYRSSAWSSIFIDFPENEHILEHSVENGRKDF
jgi:hypothetical protein